MRGGTLAREIWSQLYSVLNALMDNYGDMDGGPVFHLGGYLGSRYLPGCKKFTRVFFSAVRFVDSISRRNYLNVDN